MRAGSTFKHNTDLQRFHDDIVKACEISDSPYSSDAIWSVLNTYSDFFKGAPTSFRTTTHERRDVNARYIEFGVPHDPFPMALEAGLIKREGHPVENIIPEMQARFPFDGFGGYGVDFGASYGLEKIWGFFNGAQLIEDVYQMPSLPPSIQAHADYFAKYNLNDPRLIGVDFRSRSFNLYFFACDIKGYSPEVMIGMIKDSGFAVPSEELLGYCIKSLPIYYTFTWDSPSVERLCFCTVVEREEAPTHLHPVIQRYVSDVPVLNPHSPFVLNITMARGGDYVKIENDYTGTVGLAMRDFVPAPMARSSRVS